jgi:dolichol-phosphate mannosyltransferase
MANQNHELLINCFLIPIYNEEENLDTLFTNLINNAPNATETHFIFVDDCSQDQSISKINTLFANTNYEVLSKSQNEGPGDSFNLGFEHILKKFSTERDVRVITMEADNTSDIKLLPTMLVLSDCGYDLVLASVYAQGGGFSNTSFFRKLLSFTANMVFRMVFNIKVLTLSSFYRVYDIQLLRKIKDRNEKIIQEKGFICMLEILIKAIREEAKLIEVPMVLKSDERVGKSKMKVFKNSISYIRFLFSFKLNRE